MCKTQCGLILRKETQHTTTLNNTVLNLTTTNTLISTLCEFKYGNTSNVELYILSSRNQKHHWDCVPPGEEGYHVFHLMDKEFSFNYHDGFINQRFQKKTAKHTTGAQSGNRKLKVQSYEYWPIQFGVWHDQGQVAKIRRVIKSAQIEDGAITPTLQNLGKAVSNVNGLAIGSQKDLSLTLWQYFQGARFALIRHTSQYGNPHPVTCYWNPNKRWRCGPELLLNIYERRGWKNNDKKLSCI